MAYADQQMSGNRIIAIIIVALIHVVVGYALVSGLAYSATKKLIERVTTVDIEEPPPPEPEEVPPPPENAPPPPVAPPPPINIAVAPPPIQVQTVIPPPQIEVPRVATVPPPPPPPPPSQARAATPQNQANWSRRIIENYPARALRAEQEGSVTMSVTIDPNGRVSACNVTRSSGHSVLDEAACRDMQRYARYNPALDAAGNPTTGTATQVITYQIR